MSKPGVYSTYVEYKRAFLPREEDKLPYDDPDELGRVLAKKHLQVVRKTVKRWARERAKKTQQSSPKG